MWQQLQQLKYYFLVAIIASAVTHIADRSSQPDKLSIVTNSTEDLKKDVDKKSSVATQTKKVKNLKTGIETTTTNTLALTDTNISQDFTKLFSEKKVEENLGLRVDFKLVYDSERSLEYQADESYDMWSSTQGVNPRKAAWRVGVGIGHTFK